MVKFATNASGAIWLTNASGILFSWRDYSSFTCYTLGPLCLWQCLHLHCQTLYLVCIFQENEGFCKVPTVALPPATLVETVGSSNMEENVKTNNLVYCMEIWKLFKQRWIEGCGKEDQAFHTVDIRGVNKWMFLQDGQCMADLIHKIFSNLHFTFYNEENV